MRPCRTPRTGPSGLRPPISPAPPLARRRRQVGLRTLFLLVIAFAVWITYFNDRRGIATLEKRIATLRPAGLGEPGSRPTCSPDRGREDGGALGTSRGASGRPHTAARPVSPRASPPARSTPHGFAPVVKSASIARRPAHRPSSGADGGQGRLAGRRHLRRGGVALGRRTQGMGRRFRIERRGRVFAQRATGRRPALGAVPSPVLEANSQRGGTADTRAAPPTGRPKG